jgi:hypothetical protein
MNEKKKTSQKPSVLVWLKRGSLSIHIRIIALPLAGLAYQAVAAEIGRHYFPAPLKWWT